MGNASTYLELVDELGGELLATLELGDGSLARLHRGVEVAGHDAVPAASLRRGVVATLARCVVRALARRLGVRAEAWDTATQPPKGPAPFASEPESGPPLLNRMMQALLAPVHFTVFGTATVMVELAGPLLFEKSQVSGAHNT